MNPNAELSREQIIKEKASRRTKDGKKKEAPSNLTASVTTEKTTMGHNGTVEAREKAYQVKHITNTTFKYNHFLKFSIFTVAKNVTVCF